MSFELELIGAFELIFSYLFFPFHTKLANLNISMRKEVEFNHCVLKG